VRGALDTSVFIADEDDDDFDELAVDVVHV
jgi:hypothetical protein